MFQYGLIFVQKPHQSFLGKLKSTSSSFPCNVISDTTTEGDARAAQPSPQRLDLQELLWNEEILVEIGKNSLPPLSTSRQNHHNWMEPPEQSSPPRLQQQVTHLPIGPIGFELIGSGKNSFDFLRKDISYPSNCVSSVAGKEIFLFFVLFGFGRISRLTIKSGLELGWVCVCVCCQFESNFAGGPKIEAASVRWPDSRSKWWWWLHMENN